MKLDKEFKLPMDVQIFILIVLTAIIATMGRIAVL